MFESREIQHAVIGAGGAHEIAHDWRATVKRQGAKVSHFQRDHAAPQIAHQLNKCVLVLINDMKGRRAIGSQFTYRGSADASCGSYREHATPCQAFMQDARDTMHIL